MQGIVGRGRSFDDDIRRLDFKRLLCAFRHDENAFDAQRRTDVLACDFVVVSKFFTLENNLNVLEKAAVVQFDKSKVLLSRMVRAQPQIATVFPSKDEKSA